MYVLTLSLAGCPLLMAGHTLQSCQQWGLTVAAQFLSTLLLALLCARTLRRAFRSHRLMLMLGNFQRLCAAASLRSRCVKATTMWKAHVYCGRSTRLGSRTV